MWTIPVPYVTTVAFERDALAVRRANRYHIPIYSPLNIALSPWSWKDGLCRPSEA